MGIASEERCSDKRKPKIERLCRLQACSASWFTTSWSKCSQPCGQGEIVREVICLRGDYRTVCQECRRAERPERVQVCNEQRCMDKETRDQHSDVEEVDNNIVLDIDVNEGLSMEEMTTNKPPMSPTSAKP